MPSVSEMFPGKYLKKEDIEEDLVVTIKSVAQEEMPGDGHEQRWVLYFKELEKGLVFPKTTGAVLQQAFGRSEQWPNNKVTLYVDPNVLFKGQIVGGIRLRPIKAKTTKAAMEALAKKKPPPEDFNDEIPAQ